MPDVLLLAPPLGFESPYPLRLASVAASLREAGADVAGLDLRRMALPVEEALRAISGTSPRLAVVETSIRNLRSSRNAVCAVKHLFGCHVAVCGTAAALAPEVFLNSYGADTILRGDEETSLFLLETHDSSPPEEANEFLPLDSLPNPDREVFPLEDYAFHHFRGTRRHAAVEWSRGCPFDCSFCPVPTRYGGTWRCRNAEAIVDEMIVLRERYGVESFYVEDEQPLADRAWFVEVLDTVRERLPGVELLFPNGFWPTLLDDDLVDRMAQAGVTRISLGVESGDAGLRRRIGRPIDERHLRRLLTRLRKKGIESTGTFLLGFEKETFLDRLETLRYAAMSAFDYVHFSVLWPFRPPVEELPSGSAGLSRLRSLGYAASYASPQRLARLTKTGDLTPRYLLTALKRYRLWNRAGSTGGGAW